MAANKRLLNATGAFKWRNSLPVIALAVIVGVIFVWSILAAGTPIAFEAESGALSGCAATATPTGASGSSAVEFKACTATDATDPTNLDATGATIPDTAYKVGACDVATTTCANTIFMDDSGSDSNAGTKAAPVKTINKAVTLVPAGGTIVIRAGTYRDWYSSGSSFGTISKAVTIQAYPHEQVWFDGTDVETASNWTSDGAGHWSMAWSTPSFCSNAYYTFNYNEQSGSTANPGANSGPCTHYDNIGDSAHPAAADPQMIFKNGAYVPEVSSLAAVGANSFYYSEDLAGKTGRLYIGFNPSGVTVEAAARPIALNMSAANSKVLGIGFRRYATNEYDNTTKSALRIGGNNSLAENDVFTANAGGALYVGSVGGVANHVAMVGNGFTAMGSNGHQHSDGSPDGLVIENSIAEGNNNEYFGLNCSASCAAAGIKLGHMDGFTLKNNILAGNLGRSEGFWCDLACSGGVLVNNVAHNNGNDGLMYEVSDTGIIAGNLAYNNGNYGIRSASANTKVYNNTMINNGTAGLWIYDDSRSFNNPDSSGHVWTDVGPDTANVSVANNIIYSSNASNTLVRLQATSTTYTNTQINEFFSLFNYNSYYRTSVSQDFVRWIPPSGTAETTYKSLASWTSAHGYDVNSFDQDAGADPFFANVTGGDYTVRSNSQAYHSGTAIPADVASALGVTTAAGQTRGAFDWPGK